MDIKEYVNWKMSHDIKYNETEGYPLVLKNCRGNKKLKDLKIYGNSIQNGEPTPDNPVEVQSVGDYDAATGKYKVPITIGEENLYTSTSICKFQNAQLIEALDGGFIAQMKSSASNAEPGSTKYSSGWVTISNGFIKSESYYVSYDVEFLEKVSGEFELPITHVVGSSTIHGTSIKAFNKAYHVEAKIRIAGDGVIRITCNSCKIKVTNLVISKNGTKPITTNILLDEPLRRITNSKTGLTFEDYIDFGKQQVVRNIYREVITEVDSKSSNGNVFLSAISKKPFLTPVKYGGGSTSYIGYALSNKFMQHIDTYSNIKNDSDYIMSYITTGDANRVAYTFKDTSINTVEEAQTAIGDGFEVCYVLDIAEEKAIELPPLPQFKGTTIYELGTSIEPNNMYAKYIKKN